MFRNLLILIHYASYLYRVVTCRKYLSCIADFNSKTKSPAEITPLFYRRLLKYI